MNLSTALRLGNAPAVALVGAGGKTTALFQLAQEYKSCIVTTTTHIGRWQIPQNGIHFVWAAGDPMPDISSHNGNGILILTGELEGDRYSGLNDPQINELNELQLTKKLPLLIEADGAREKPLKAPAAHEPAIPDFADTVVVTVGMSVLGRILNEDNVHRSERFSQLAELETGKPITADAIGRMLSHPEGGFKKIPKGSRKIALLNQADTPELQSQAKYLAQRILPSFDAVIIASLASVKAGRPMGRFILAVYEQIAGIILAAGGSTRFGQPKQLLEYRGKPFIRIVAETALSASLNPVIVVIGAHGDSSALALEGLNVQIVQNMEWQKGQSTSILAGLKKLPEKVGGAIFLLVDQPQITSSVLRSLMEKHFEELPPVLAPYVLDRRANPVLFDRVTFEDLRNLKGDQGGRAIFSQHQPAYMDWADDRLLLDVDSPEDYQHLLDMDHDE